MSVEVHGPRRERWLPVAVFLIAALVYTLTLSSYSAEAEDVLRYVHEVSQDDPALWLHPHHLLFNVVHRGFYAVWQGLGYPGTAGWPMQVLNLLGGALALALLAALLVRLRLGAGLALLAAAFTGVSFAFWHYAVTPDTYILPLALALFVLQRALALLQSERGRDWLLLGLGMALMVLLHQQHALFASVLTLSLGLALVTRQPPGPARWRCLRPLLLASGGAVALIVASYLLAGVGVLGYRTPTTLLNWMLGYARTDIYHQWGHWSATGPLQALVGASRALLGGHALYAHEALADGLVRLFPAKVLVEERYLVAAWGAGQRALAWTLLASVVPVALALVLRLVTRRAPPGAADGGADRTWVRRTAWAVVGVYTLFNIWWEPLNPEFWIFPLPFLVMVAALRLATLNDPTTQRLAALLTLLLAAANYSGSIRPMQDPDRDYWNVLNRTLIPHLWPGDVVLTNSGYIAWANLQTQSPATVLWVRDPPPPAAAELAGRALALTRATGGTIFASSWVVAPPAALMATGKNAPRPEVITLLAAHGRWEPVPEADAVQDLWRLRP